MQLISYLFLLLVHFVTGFGILRLLRIRPDNILYICVSIILGLGVASFLPFLLDLAHIPLTKNSVYGFMLLVAAGFGIPAFLGKEKIQFVKPGRPGLYELPFFVIFFFIVFVSVWRCYYNPVAARDMIVGPEVISEVALKEHTFANSVFTFDHTNNNNQFKPASIASLQVIYKMGGFVFGQMWLSILFIFFTLFLYQLMIRKIHPLLACMLLVLYLAIPEMYAYSFMILFDYPNTVFLTLSCYFLYEYLKEQKRGYIITSMLFMSIAVYFRAETLVINFMLMPVILFSFYRRKINLKTAILPFVLLVVFPVLAYWLPNGLFNKYYIPVHYGVADQVNKHLTDLGPFWQRFSDINSELIFGEFGVQLYAYFMYFFLVLLAAELIIKRKLSREGAFWLFTVGVIYIALPLLGFLLPLMDLNNTTKRGMFKLFPLMLLFMANSQLLTGLSGILERWELKASGKTA